MADISIRGLDENTLARIDREAKACGLSRNEYLCWRLSTDYPVTQRAPLDTRVLAQSTLASQDLLDPTVMASSWR